MSSDEVHDLRLDAAHARSGAPARSHSNASLVVGVEAELAAAARIGDAVALAGHGYLQLASRLARVRLRP